MWKVQASRGTRNGYALHGAIWKDAGDGAGGVCAGGAAGDGGGRGVRSHEYVYSGGEPEHGGRGEKREAGGRALCPRRYTAFAGRRNTRA